MDLDLQVGPDDDLVDEQADETLTCREVCRSEPFLDLADKVGEPITELATSGRVSKRCLCLLRRFGEPGFASIDLLASSGELFDLQHATLIGVQEPLELLVALLELPRQPIQFGLCRSVRCRIVEPRVACNTFGISHHFA